MLSQFLFLFLAGIAIIAALAVVLVRNTVHGALFLGLCLFMVAGLYGLLGADFLFAAQVLIYVGAIAILFLFVVLLAGRRAEIAEKPFNKDAFPGALAAAIIIMILAGVLLQAKEALRVLIGREPFEPSTASVGEAILSQQTIAMEILGVILLAALVGATLLSRGLMEKADGEKAINAKNAIDAKDAKEANKDGEQ